MASKGTRPKPSVRKAEYVKTDFNSLSSKEKGLVSQCYKKKQIIIRMGEQQALLMEHYLRIALMLPQDDATEMIWDYASDNGACVWYGESKLLNKKSIMKEKYDESDDITKMAHFKQDGEFICFAEQHKAGDKPIFYQGYFAVSREEFNLDWSEIVEGVLAFIPKTEAERNEYKATAATQGVKRAGLSGVISQRKSAKTSVSLDSDDDSEETDCDSE